MTEKNINVGFVGYGYTTRTFHLPAVALVPGYTIYAFVQRQEHPIDKRTGQPGPSCVEDYPKAIRYSSMSDMLADPKVDLVVVVTPQNSHAELCIQSLEAGKHGQSHALHRILHHMAEAFILTLDSHRGETHGADNTGM